MQQGTWKLRPFRHVQTGAIVDIGAYGRCSERMFWAAFAECWVWKMPSVDDKDKFKESQCFWVDLKWPTWCGKWYIAQSQNIINLASSLRWTHVVDFRCRGAAALPLQDGPMDRWTSGDVFGAARTWRMFCDCLGHHQRDQHWSRGAGSAVEWRNGDFLGINFGDQHKNHDVGDVRPRWQFIPRFPRYLYKDSWEKAMLLRGLFRH